MKLRKIKVVGAGGIGGYLLEPLSRYLNSQEEYQIEITIYDGDKYEDRNKHRQRFSACENKAIHTATNLKNDFPRIHFKSKGEYLTPDNIISAIRENDIVFLCVDNHATRKLVSDRCQELENVVLISGGNEYTDGNVIVYIRKNGENLTKSLTELYPKIKNPEDKNPGVEVSERAGCEQEVMNHPQLIFTNLAIASCMCNVYYAYEQDKVKFDQVYVDVIAQKMRPSKEN